MQSGGLKELLSPRIGSSISTQQVGRSQEKPQDFELIELLIREAGLGAEFSHSSPSTSTQQESSFKSFKARFQSYVDQIPSYLHSVGKEGFFPHFFLGSFSTLIDMEIAKNLDIEKIYFRFDSPQTLKVAVIKSGKIKHDTDAIQNIKLFSISEHDSNHKSCKFTSGELEDILKKLMDAGRARGIKDRIQGTIESKLIHISKNNIGKEGIPVGVESKKIDESAASHKFHEIKKGLWSNPESDIVKLSDANTDKVKESIGKILKKIGTVHSKYKESLSYAYKAREAAHHGFMVGALVNFRYRHNLRAYLEQLAVGYADIILLPRGKERSLNSIPIIIEMKAFTSQELYQFQHNKGHINQNSETTPTRGLKQAQDYAKSFQPNVMRVLTTADNILCVGINFDHPSPISEIIVKSRNQDITPLFNDILVSINKRNNDEISEEQLKTRIQKNIERVYHTFPGTKETGDHHYFSRFLLGQSLLLNQVKTLGTNFEKHVFIYDEKIPTEAQSEPKSQRLKDKKIKGQDVGQPSSLDQSHAVTTMVFIPEDDEKLVYVMNVIEADGRAEVLKKGIPLDDLNQAIGNRKIVELNLNFNTKEKKAEQEKKFEFEKYFSIEVNEAISLKDYTKKKTDKFQGHFENVPYPEGFKKTFDEALTSQLTSSQGQSLSIDNYKKLFGQIGEAMFPFKGLIEKEAHTQAVFHGAFSHYSDVKLGEPNKKNRALILTEFQTGRGKRIDMLVHGIKFADQDSNAKEYIPVGLEIKGPRGDKTTNALVEEANDQISTEYEKGVTYKTLTDGDEVVFMGVVFDKEKNDPNDANELIKLSKDDFVRVKVVHSSIFQIHPSHNLQGLKGVEEQSSKQTSKGTRG